MRAAALGLFLGIAVACTSGFESAGIVTELIVKGQTVLKEADQKMRDNRPEAAYIIVRRHMNDIDAAIGKTEKDSLIEARDRAHVLSLLKDYRREIQAVADHARSVTTFESDVQTRIRGNPRLP